MSKKGREEEKGIDVYIKGMEWREAKKNLMKSSAAEFLQAILYMFHVYLRKRRRDKSNEISRVVNKIVIRTYAEDIFGRKKCDDEDKLVLVSVLLIKAGNEMN